MENTLGNNISVVIPLYNSEKELPQLIEGLKKQTDRDFEVILVDDNSRDNTYNVAQAIIDNDRRFKIFKNESNLGSGYTRNYGVERALNSIILFLDYDVIPSPNLIYETKSFFNDVSAYKAVTGISDGVSIRRSVIPQFLALFDYYDSVYKKRKFITLFDPRVGAIKKDFFQKIGGFNTKYKGASIEDYEISSRITQRGRIYLNKKMIVSHNFPDFKRLAFNNITRGYYWFQLFIRNFRFGNYGNATLFGAISTFLSIPFWLFLFRTVFSLSSIFYSLFIYLIFILLYWRFLIFSVKRTHRILFFFFYPFIIIYFFTLCGIGCFFGALGSLIIFLSRLTMIH